MRVVFNCLVACLLLLAPLPAGAADLSGDALFRRAVDAQQRGDFPAAIRDYRRFLEQSPRSLDAHANLGAALAQSGQFEEAATEYRAALAIDGTNPAIHQNLALTYYKQGDFARAADEFAFVHKAQPDDLRAAILLGDCWGRLARPEQAAALLEPIEAVHPGNPDLEFVLGSALVHSNRRKAGAELLERVGAATQGADAWLLAGSARLDLNDFEVARADLDKALAINPSLPGLHTQAGVVRDKLGDQAAAESELRLGLAANPDDAQANLVLGAILFKQRQNAEARRLVERSLRADPGSVLAHYELALIEIATEEPQAAAAELEGVEAKTPQWIEPHVRLATLYYKLHRPSDGIREKQTVDRLTAEQQAQETAAKPHP